MKVGIFGYGSIGSRHGANLCKLQTGDVLAYDPIHYSDPSYRENILRQCDAIIIASPSKNHALDLMDVINAGKHTLVEKPIGYDCPPLLEGFVIGARNRYPGLIMATGFNLRFHSCVKYVAIRLHELGEIQNASFSVMQKSTKDAYLRDGVIRNWLSHEIDLAHYLLGSSGRVVSCTVEDQVEANITMVFPNTVRGKVYISGDYITEPHQRYFWLEGDKANFYVNLERREVYKREGNSDPVLVFQGTDTWDDNYIDEMKCFIASIEAGRHLNPLATAEDGVLSLYTVMDAYNMAERGELIPRPIWPKI